MVDKETKDVIDAQRKAYDLANSEEWNWAKGKLMSLVADISSISNVDPKADNLMVDIAAKQLAVETILEWIKEVEAEAFSYPHTQAVNEEDIIKRFD